MEMSGMPYVHVTSAYDMCVALQYVSLSARAWSEDAAHGPEQSPGNEITVAFRGRLGSVLEMTGLEVGRGYLIPAQLLFT